MRLQRYHKNPILKPRTEHPWEARAVFNGAAVYYNRLFHMTLLRGPTYPDPNADQGEHHFTYSLLPHRGDWQMGTVPAAYLLSDPLIVSLGTHGRRRTAGEMVNGGTVARLRWQGIDPERYLAENDSYQHLSQAGDLIVTGPTSPAQCGEPLLDHRRNEEWMISAAYHPPAGTGPDLSLLKQTSTGTLGEVDVSALQRLSACPACSLSF